MRVILVKVIRIINYFSEDLELHLEDVNVCLMEKTRIVEILEEKLEHQNEKMLQLQEEINKLKNEKLVLIKSYEEKLKSKISFQNEYQEIIIKEELITNEISDSNMIRENMKERIENAKVSINEIKETNSNSLNPIEKTISKEILVDTNCQVNITNDKAYNDIKNKLEENTQAVITTSEAIQTSSKKSLLNYN